MKKLCFALFLVLFALPSSSWAKMTYKQCFKNASAKYGVPYDTLLAVAFTESSFKPYAKNINKNGTRDYGFMQINSLWTKSAGRSGITWKQVTTNPCSNVKFGAWILRSNYRRYGNWKNAIGAYNAGFSKSERAQRTRAAYYAKVMRNKAVAKRHIHRLNKVARHTSGKAKKVASYDKEIENRLFAGVDANKPSPQTENKNNTQTTDNNKKQTASNTSNTTQNQSVKRAQPKAVVTVVEPAMLESGEKPKEYVIY